MSTALIPSEGKAFADFVSCACGREEAFVEEELAGDKAGEIGRTADFGFELVEIVTAFAARQRDMRLEGTSLGDEAAGLGGRDDAFMKQEQLRRKADTGKENSGAIEAAKLLKANRNRRRVQRTQASDNAGKLFRAGVA